MDESLFYVELSDKASIQDNTRQRLAEYIQKLIGERSIRKTAEDSGVTASYIAAILKNKYMPSAEVLKKLASPSAKPRNGICLEDLMVAAGYQANYIDNPIVEISDTEEDDRLEEKRSKSRERSIAIDRFESIGKGIIYRSLAENDIRFSKNSDEIRINGFKPDISIFVAKDPILEWWFDFIFIDPEMADDTTRLRWVINSKLGRLILLNPDLVRKLSLVVSNPNAFNAMLRYKDCLSFRGDLSIILIDEDTFSVVNEIYLSHYNLDSKPEFVLKPN